MQPQIRATRWPVQPVSVAAEPAAEPAVVVAVTAFVLQILDRLSTRPPESLSTAEADLQAFFAGGHGDLVSILERARAEMGAAAINILRRGEV